MRPAHVLALVVLAGSLGGAAEARAERVVDRVVATIDDKPILLSEVRARERRYATTVTDATRLELDRAILNELVEERLLADLARRQYLAVTAKEIDAAIESVLAQTHLSPSELTTQLEKSGVSASDYRAALEAQLVRGKVLQVRASRDHVKLDKPQKYQELSRIVVAEERAKRLVKQWL